MSSTSIRPSTAAGSKVRLVNPPGTESIYESFKFSQAVVAGGRVDVSGQVGVTPELSIPDDITDQAEQAFANLRNVLEAAGSSLANVTQLTMYYTDIGDSQAVDKIFTKFFPERYPARTAVQVVSLVLPQLKLEIQASAVLDD
jgi:reactive intermediate/imine deaminase